MAFAASLSAAQAEASDDTRLRGLYAPSGLSLGVSARPSGPAGFQIGAEQSLAYYTGPRRDIWFGLYGDALYDFGPRKGRLGLGPELGWGPLGFDGGFVAQVGGGQTLTGLEGRALLGIGLASAFARVGHLFGSTDSPNFFEFGLLLKYPFSISTHERP